MIKTIVTGVDGSPTAALAARKAAELATAAGAELHVISVYGKFAVERLPSGSEEFVFTTADEAVKNARSTVETLRGEFPSLRITAAPSEGKPAQALLKAAQHVEADLVVVGNKRVQGFARVLGSVARDVAAHAECDVYVAHTHER